MRIQTYSKMAIIIVFFLLVKHSKAQDGMYSNFSSNKNCTLLNITLNSSTNMINNYKLDQDWDGMVNLRPFSISEFGEWGGFVNILKNDSNITFKYLGNENSNLFVGKYHSFQQYYKNVLVEGGGFKLLTNQENSIIINDCPICPPVDMCDEIEMISPFIYEMINIPVDPIVKINEIPSILNIKASDLSNFSKKIILDGNTCNYRLIWEINYINNSGNNLRAEIDAMDGQILKNNDLTLYKEAPVYASGFSFNCANLNDSQSGGKTFLRNSKIKVVDLDVEDKFVEFLDVDVPSSPSNRVWNCVNSNCFGSCIDGSVDAFELFYNADRIINYLSDNYNINLSGVNLAYNKQTTNAYVFQKGGAPATYENSFLVFGKNPGNNESYTDFEVVAHELAHIVLLKYLNQNTTDSHSLHEGLANILSIFLEYKINGFFNWVLGESVSSNPSNIATTKNNCVSNFTVFNDVHERGEALVYFYYLLVNGNSTSNIKAISQENIIEILLESLKGLGTSTPNWKDLMKATLINVAKKYGTCSNEYNSFARAWEKICVPTGVPSATNFNAPCTNISGPNYICEEDDQFKFCLESNSGIDYKKGSWTVFGNSNTDFESYLGMVGNSQFGGNCIYITDIPKFPYYPQTITIQYSNNEVNKVISKSIKIIDCNHDDPTCEEYYNLGISNYNSKNSDNYKEIIIENKTLTKEMIERDSERIVIYDIMGNEISECDIRDNPDALFNKIIIYTYWDENGKMVKVKKQFKL